MYIMKNDSKKVDYAFLGIYVSQSAFYVLKRYHDQGNS